ncbi:rhodanese-like domain-containing protein [Candidatus Woesearchaeota archaeon]|nr:rhodanese-like domain-containing protein [Candidatus Woesearchaeota archaeon]
MKAITESVLKERGKRKSYVLLHVTSKPHGGHLSGSKDISISDLRKKAKQLFPNKEKEIIVYSDDERQAEDAVRQLESLGYKNVIEFESGMEGWKALATHHT